MFNVIPVIDLMDGMVVHGKGGQRDHYQPVRSRLCDDAQPLTVVKALCDLHPFKILYVADLDAIQGGESQSPLLQRLLDEFVDLTLWCDSGLVSAADVARRISHPCLSHIVGSETLINSHELTKITAANDSTPILSMDFKGQHFLGDAQLLKNPSEWPAQVIVLNLSHVGASSGPPTAQLNQLAETVNDRQRLIAGGGVRDAADLRELKDQGYGGALVATALHNGKISAEQLQALS